MQNRCHKFGAAFECFANVQTAAFFRVTSGTVATVSPNQLPLGLLVFVAHSALIVECFNGHFLPNYR